MKNYLNFALLGLIYLFVGCSDDKTTNENPVLSEEWVSVALPQEVEGLLDIEFLDDNFGIASGNSGALIKTIDGGLSWESMSVMRLRHGFNAAGAISEDVFFTGRQLLYKTEDGGSNFSESGSFSENGAIFSIDFPSSNIGFLTKSGRVFKTDDNGNTWTIVHTSEQNIYDSYASKMLFPSASLGFFYGGRSNESFSYGDFYRTTDAGVTWTKIEADSEITALSFAGNQIGYYADFSNQIFKTENGGESWVSVGNVSQPFSDMLFEDENTGYGVNVIGQILKTTNGGVAWSVVYESEEVGSLSKLVKTPNGEMFVVGQSNSNSDAVMFKRTFIGDVR